MARIFVTRRPSTRPARAARVQRRGRVAVRKGPERPAADVDARLVRTRLLGHRLGTTFGVGQRVGRGSPETVQRLIVRIRDLGEMSKVRKPTIMNASKRLKKGEFRKDDLLGQQDVGITKATKKGFRKLGKTESLVVVAHGSAPSISSLLGFRAPTLGGFGPASLAAKLINLFPEGYKGSIYLDGCYTGKRLAYQDGTSFIELFAKALGELRGDTAPTVKGNIGAATTSKNGIEYIELTKSEAEIGRKRGWNIIEKQVKSKTEHYVASPFGLAFATSDGRYNDYGLSEQARLIAHREREKEIQRNAERERRRRLNVIRQRGGRIQSPFESEGNVAIGNADL